MESEVEPKLPAPLTAQVIGCATEVHRVLGPGLLESIYEHCLAHELTAVDIPVERQRKLPVPYKGETLNCGYRIDLWVAGRLIVEIKSVDSLQPIHQAQLLTYLRLTRCRTGLLINFNVPLLKQGLKRMAL